MQITFNPSDKWRPFLFYSDFGRRNRALKYRNELKTINNHSYLTLNEFKISSAIMIYETDLHAYTISYTKQDFRIKT